MESRVNIIILRSRPGAYLDLVVRRINKARAANPSVGVVVVGAPRRDELILLAFGADAVLSPRYSARALTTVVAAVEVLAAHRARSRRPGRAARVRSPRP